MGQVAEALWTATVHAVCWLPEPCSSRVKVIEPVGSGKPCGGVSVAVKLTGAPPAGTDEPSGSLTLTGAA